MTRARWLIAGSWLLGFWLLAGMVWAPALEQALTAGANAAAAGMDTGYEPPQVVFSGQHAEIRGQVRREEQRAAVEARVREKIQAVSRLAPGWGQGLNPVAGVTNRLRTVPFPPGWLLVAANGLRGQLVGVAATDAEARDVAAVLQDRWADLGGRLEPRVQARQATHDEAPDALRTLKQAPPPLKVAGGDGAQIQICRIGEAWQRLAPDTTEAELRDRVLKLGISQADWEGLVLPSILAVRRNQAAERARVAEAERQARLPPPYVFLAARDKRLLVRGELAAPGLKLELLNALISQFPDWRILDDLRVNAGRRRVGDFGPITTALLPPGAESGGAEKSLVLGLPGAAWKPIVWETAAAAQPWPELLPGDLPAAQVQEDLRTVAEWLAGGGHGIPSLPVRAQPSFLTLTLLPDKVILAGQLAEEALRTQMIEAAQQTYAGRAVVLAEGLLARGTCEPTADIQQTMRSLPVLPSGEQPPVLAFARPGGAWRTVAATMAALDPGALTASGILPEDFPAGMAEDTFADAFDHVRHYWQGRANQAKKEAER